MSKISDTGNHLKIARERDAQVLTIIAACQSTIYIQGHTVALCTVHICSKKGKNVQVWKLFASILRTQKSGKGTTHAPTYQSTQIDYGNGHDFFSYRLDRCHRI